MPRPSAGPIPTLLLLLGASSAHPQWQMQQSNTTAGLRGITTAGDGIAWASGTEGTVLHTTDGGATWQTCPTPPGAEHLDFRGIQAFDDKTAIVMSSGKGDLSRLYKTTDACHTWTLLFTNPDKDGFWDAVQFALRSSSTTDKSFGEVVGDPVDHRFSIFVTFDSGDHWERQVKQAPEAESGEGLFAASNSSLLVHHVWERGFITGGPRGARLLTYQVVADDQADPEDLDADVSPGAKPFYGPGKRRWHVQKLPLAYGTSAGAFSIGLRLRGQNGEYAPDLVIVGGDYKESDDSQGVAAFRLSTQLEFKLSRTPPHGYRSSVAYDATHNTWITVGPNGTDISTDDGKNWHALKPSPAAGDPPDADRDWNALSLPFVVGPHGRIGRLRPEALPPSSHPRR